MASIFQIEPKDLHPFRSPTPGQITLVAGYPNAGSNVLDNSLCREIAQCGFNCVAAIITLSAITESLNNCAAYNLNLLLANNSLNDEGEDTVISFVNNFTNKRGLGGWFLRAQATESEITESSNLKKSYDAIYKYDYLKHPIYIGLPGDWHYDVSNNIIPSYPTMLAKFLEFFQPGFWSYAYFPDLSPSVSRFYNFYRTLQYYAYISRYTAAPFWAYCRCQGVSNYYGHNGGVPDLKMMRGIVFSSLAYGAQGIYFWNYRESVSTNATKFSNAPVNLNGTINLPVWSNVQTILNEVRTFNDIFYGCEMVDCRYFPGLQDLKRFTHPMGPLMDVISPSGNPALLISHLFNNGKNYLVIVANPYETSIRNVLFRFSEYWKVYKLSLNSSGYEETLVSNNSESMNFTPGDYVIFRWE